MVSIDKPQIISLIQSARTIICNKRFRGRVVIDGRNDIVTQVDTIVQNYIKDELIRSYPEVQFISEEQTINDFDTTKPAWILDPMDGTTNLYFDFQHSALSLSFYDGKEITFGLIYNPFTEELFTATKGEGAYLFNRTNPYMENFDKSDPSVRHRTDGIPIHVTNNRDMAHSLIAIGTSPYNKADAKLNFRDFEAVFENCLDIRRTGSSALDFAYVASGRIDGYFERKLSLWDYAAGYILVKEAGGRMTDIKGDELKHLMISDVLATNGSIHEEFAKCIQDVG